jgi:hypothetical protein
VRPAIMHRGAFGCVPRGTVSSDGFVYRSQWYTCLVRADTY